ncbi:hypothetical protein H8A95_41470 [Bradyrhizobium sp. Pear76]|uniref:hypothetical protein n=1 Tax=Bradyrhizobium oropedii TaxID=1571201 RepID=UPI001E2A0CE5|nr:hypothetical protein [Bradyrhizobium oropedii]MCC8968581.1 hypothetical protein [Bradyrhizobium oropedii]
MQTWLARSYADCHQKVVMSPYAEPQVRDGRHGTLCAAIETANSTPLYRPIIMSCQSPSKMHDILSVQAIEFRQAMRNLVSGVANVTTGAAVRPRGLTISSV